MRPKFEPHCPIPPADAATVVQRPLRSNFPHAKKTNGRHSPRPDVSLRSRRGVPVANGGDAEAVYGGTNFTTQRLVVVRTGTASMRREFFKWCERYRVGWEHIGADEHAEHARDRDGADRARFQFVTSEFLIWGKLSDVETFLARNTGEGLCVASYSDVVAVRVTTGTGSGTPSAAAEKRIRDMMRGKVEREAREEREELNRVHTANPDSPYCADRQRYARDVAALLAPQLFPELTDKAREGMRRHLAEFIHRKDRVPETRSEFETWLKKHLA